MPRAVIDAAGFKKFTADVRRADKTAKTALFRRIKDKVTAVVVPDVKSRAGWSSRIPGSVKVSVTAKGVSVKAGGSKAPHAAAFENKGRPGVFRHPVFGDRQIWVDQQARPFLRPAGEAHTNDLLDAVVEALDDWATEIGFR